eukprot:8308258-Prorocentrum_lima.AAC.1
MGQDGESLGPPLKFYMYLESFEVSFPPVGEEDTLEDLPQQQQQQQQQQDVEDMVGDGEEEDEEEDYSES